MISAHNASYSASSVSDEVNYRSGSLNTALETKLYSASNIMEQFGIDPTSCSGHGKFTAAVLTKILEDNRHFDVQTVGYVSLFKNFQFMPETSSVSNDARPDVGIFFQDRLVCIFEEDSTKNERSVTKSCHYARALCRLKSINGEGQEGVCFIFPSALDEVRNEPMAVVRVSCQWDYECCRFIYTGQAIALCDLGLYINSVIEQQQPVVVEVSRDAKYLYKFSTTAGLGYFGYRYNHQYPSARSIVLNVGSDSGEEFVLKFVDAKTFKRLQKLSQSTNNPSILHYFKYFDFEMKYDCSLSALMFEKLAPPLFAIDAKNCLKDFIHSLYIILEDVHKIHFEHCDLRLENICFRYDARSNSYNIVLIDIDFSAFTGRMEWKSPLLALAKLSCLYRNILNVTSVDYHQLGYMIVWVHLYGTEVMLSGKKMKIGSNEHYHNMDIFGESVYDKDEFVEKLITKGELFSFVFLI